jgi:RimJ/RimL family protein N-acetyltransferase
MIDVIDFKPEHAAMLKRSTYDPDPSSESMFMGKTDCVLVYAKLGRTITVMDGDIVLGIGGVVKIWNGVGEVWCRISDEGRMKQVAAFKAMKEFLDDCFKNGYHRIQTCITEEHSVAHRCILRLGFIPEGMKIHYGPNKEHFVSYVRLA